MVDYPVHDMADITENPDAFRQLWAMVLQRAVDDLFLQKVIHEKGKNRGNNKNSASRWIFNGNSQLFNSFENVCLILDLDPERVRNTLRHRIQKNGVNYA